MAKATKTINPLPFESLEPHRFEDLVRQLVYDFKDWQSIEATGRSGSDDGYDIRAWEKRKEVVNEGDKDEDEEGRHTIEGNLWMVQCKREKELGPARVKNIVKNGIKKESPYGYILAAPANFSKKSYDTFREELRKKGVSEFYIWSRAELEDMLLIPKNDRILFTFFGISLVTKKRSRTSEIRFVVNIKNKLMRVFGNEEDMHKSILVRDFTDIHYPHKDEYEDFEKHKRWKEHIVRSFLPLGLYINLRQFHGFVDHKKKVFDFTDKIDFVYRTKDEKRDNTPESQKEWERITDFWKHLPRANQADFIIDGLLAFEDILLIDDKGDTLYDFPHVFADFHSHQHPFKSFWHILQQGKDKYDRKQFYIDKTYKRVKVFPNTFTDIKIGKIYEDIKIDWDEETLRLFKLNHDIIKTLYDASGKYSFLKPRDVILVIDEGSEQKTGMRESIGLGKQYIEITHKYSTTAKKLFAENPGFGVQQDAERQIGRKIKTNEKIAVMEFDRQYEWWVKGRTKKTN